MIRFIKWHLKEWKVKGIFLLTFGIVIGIYWFGTEQEFIWCLIGALAINLIVLIGNYRYFKIMKL